VSKWSDTATIVKSTHRLPPTHSSGWDRAKYFGNGLFVSESLKDNGLVFLRIPSVASQKQIEGWSIPPVAFKILGYTAYPLGNVIAVAEQKEKCVPGVPSLFKVKLITHSFIRIHFLNIQNGSPYCTPPSNIIMWEFPSGADPITIDRIAITSSRVAMCVYYCEEDLTGDVMVRRILVWDRETGELVGFHCSYNYTSLSPPHQVLDLSSTSRREPGQQNPRVIFLDEFRMIVVPDEWAITELVVFNTLIPQGHPGNLRRFGFPPGFRHWRAKIFVDHDRDLGAPNRDEAFIVDPAQAVIAMQLGEHWEPHLLFVARTQVLIEQSYSVRTDSCIPWDEWREDVVVVEIPMFFSILPTFVHGTKVAVVGTNDAHGWPRRCHNVRTFDFGRCSSLQLRGGTESLRVLFEDGAHFEFESGGGSNSWDELRSLSDESVFCLVSCLL